MGLVLPQDAATLSITVNLREVAAPATDSRLQRETPMHSVPLLSVERIATAYDVIEPCFRDSPQFEAAALNNLFGCQLVLKIETLNPIRSFKGRGAQFFVSQRTDDTPLVCATAGNFGQGMAYAARKRGIPLTVFTNIDASPIKVERMSALGAQVLAVGTQPDEANAAAAQFAAETNAVLVVDGQEAAIAEGAGTIGLELLRYPGELAAVVVPLGDGALLAGIGCWVKAHSPPRASSACPRSARPRCTRPGGRVASSAHLARRLRMHSPCRRRSRKPSHACERARMKSCRLRMRH